MALGKNVILRSPPGGRLEGRTAAIQLKLSGHPISPGGGAS
jgi:hypothetical protein